MRSRKARIGLGVAGFLIVAGAATGTALATTAGTAPATSTTSTHR